MNRSDLHGGLWVHRGLLDSALWQLRRVERELRVERVPRVARAGSGCRLRRHLATYERAGFDLIGRIANRKPACDDSHRHAGAWCSPLLILRAHIRAQFRSFVLSFNDQQRSVASVLSSLTRFWWSWPGAAFLKRR
jgi:hypothetical protein